MVDRNLIRDIIVENQKFVADVVVGERDYAFEDDLNYVLVGLRRAGKSYLIYGRIQHLLSQGHSIDEMLYFNFEDERLVGMDVADLHLVLECYEEMFECRPFVFLDEIQVVDGWEKFARRLADKNYRVYITGSNAKMLSSEIATTLGGRYAMKDVYPLSFREFLRMSGLNVERKNFVFYDRSNIVRLFEEYFRFGGLPEVLHLRDKRSWLSGLYGKIFFGDLVTRYKIRNDEGLRLVVKRLAENVKQPTSYGRVANIVSSTGRKVSTDTVIDYLKYMQESWLLLPVRNISAKFGEKESNKKYYFVDNGILGLFLFDPDTSLLENLAAIALYQRYGDDFYFYNKNFEVDFFVPSEKMAIQVCYSLQDEITRKREVSALLKLAEHYEIEKMLILTKGEEEEISISDETIEVLPIWKYLLLPER